MKTCLQYTKAHMYILYYMRIHINIQYAHNGIHNDITKHKQPEATGINID